MNSIFKFGLAVTVIGYLASCGNRESNKVITKEIGKQECYVAIDGTDTAYLNLNTIESGEIDGDLLIKYLDKEQNIGTIAGKYKGDTLFVDYTFTVGKTDKPIYKNPLAFLKKDNQLILGVGQIETTLGRSYFVKGKPINFERGKFTFVATECKN